ncbi:hypothetical protein J5N97_011233 [Dioscorea zingiberensis]|uniref:H(+)/Pi cotransporter n=1 Tax=Dioscorea zingiberensis TaxID=325984 RepID=A0A9D5D0U8_9LILI|nr:hypothetical protein J5N97_011233 [Dioscorea zingiberensis]
MSDNNGQLHQATTMDEIMDSSQLLQAFFISLAWAFDAQQTFVSVFTDAQPSWHCTNSTLICTATTCTLPAESWTWDYPKHTSIISEWDLECSSTAMTGLPASAYFAGCLAGGFLLAPLADSWFGRKKVLFLTTLIMSLSGVLTAVSPNVWIYSALRFICGFARSTVCTTALVLASELVGKRWRGRVSIISFFCFTFGFLSLSVIAYIARELSLRVLYLFISIPCFFYSVLVYFVIPESPRWLLVRGRREEALGTPGNMELSNCNGISSMVGVEEERNNIGDVFSALRMLLEKKWALRRLALVMVTGFGIGMSYYGMPLGVGNLGSNIYFSVAINALAELPAALITFVLIERLNRRSLLLVFTSISGVCSIICVFMEGRWRLAAEVVSFFSACTACNVVLIYSIELFPTSVRNSALSMVRQAVVFGGVWVPMLVVAGRKEGGGGVTFAVFGIVIGCCGLLVCCLPETRGGKITDTLEEEGCKQRASVKEA